MKHNFANIQIAFNFFSNNCSKGSLKKVGSLGVGGRGLAEKQTKTNRGKGDNTHTIVLKEINHKRNVLPWNHWLHSGEKLCRRLIKCTNVNFSFIYSFNFLLYLLSYCRYVDLKQRNLVKENKKSFAAI